MIITRCPRVSSFGPSISSTQNTITTPRTSHCSVRKISQQKRTIINLKVNNVTPLTWKSVYILNNRRFYFANKPLLTDNVSSDSSQVNNSTNSNNISARDIQVQIIQTHIKLRQYGEALQFIEDTLPQLPRTDNFWTTILTLKSTCLFFLRRYAECSKTCRDVLEIDYMNPTVSAYKAISDYLRLKIDNARVIRALEDSLNTLRKDKDRNLFDLLLVHLYIARIEFSSYQLEQAEAHLDVLLDHPVLFGGVYQLQGYLLLLQKKYVEAVQAFDKELEWYEGRLLDEPQREQFIQPMLGKIQALMQLKRFDEALKCIKVVEKKNPQDIGDIEVLILHKLRALSASGRLQEMDDIEIPKLSPSRKMKNRLEFEEFTQVFVHKAKFRRYALGVAIGFWMLLTLLIFYWMQLQQDRKASRKEEGEEEEKSLHIPIKAVKRIPAKVAISEEEYEDNQVMEEEN